VALFGALGVHLPLAEAEWLRPEALREGFAAELFDANRQAFLAIRAWRSERRTVPAAFARSIGIPNDGSIYLRILIF